MANTNEQPDVGFAEWYEGGGMEVATFQPGESSWASLKCGGGIHACERLDSHPYVPPAVGGIATSREVQEIPYSGTEKPTVIVSRTLRDPLQQGV